MSDTQPLVHLVDDEEVSGRAKEIYASFTAGGGKVPKWVRVMANCDDILAGFMAMFKATMDDSPLPSLLKWKVANEVSKMNKCDFCVDVTHNKLKSMGLSDENIERLDDGADDMEKAAMNFGRAATAAAYRIDPAVIAEAKKTFSDAQLVELAAVVGLFNYINRFNDALGVLPE